jgi:hypothetical protein
VLNASTEAATIIETREEANFLFIVTFLEIRSSDRLRRAACGGSLSEGRYRMRHGFDASPGSTRAALPG